MAKATDSLLSLGKPIYLETDVHPAEIPPS